VVLDLEKDPGRPAYRRLAEAIREGILSGRFRPGDRLPPSRNLARNLGLARNTVLEAYEQLAAEGYLASRHGSGTYVASQLPERAFRPLGVVVEGPVVAPTAATSISAFAERVVHGEVATLMRRRDDVTPIQFRFGTPSLEEFPIDAWRTLTKRVLDYPPRELLGYGPTEGLPQLREALARYLQRSRGVQCTANDVIIVNGSQQALDLRHGC